MILNFPLIVEYSLYCSALGLIIYYRIFFYPLANYKTKASSFKKLPPVSIVICAKNELENLQQFLPKILTQKYPHYEVIVVDDHSTDQSYEWLLIQEKRHPNLVSLKFDREKISGGKKEALSFGIKSAKYEHVLLTDADCFPLSNNWITAMISGYSEEKEIVLGVSLYSNKQKSILSNIIEWDSIIIAIQYLSFALRNRAYMSVGRNVSYLKSTFLKNNGFDSHLHINSGDDDLFIKESATNNNIGIAIQPEAQTASYGEISWKNYFKQKSRHLSTGIHYAKSNLVLLGLFQSLTILFYSSLAISCLLGIDKWLLLTILFLKMMVQAGIFRRIFLKIGIRKRLLPFLFFDFVWVVLIFYINISNLFRVQKKW